MGIISHDEIGHGITDGGDDARHDQQQRPQQHIDQDQQVGSQGAAKIVESGKHLLQLEILFAVDFQKQRADAQGEGAANDQVHTRHRIEQPVKKPNQSQHPPFARKQTARF